MNGEKPSAESFGVTPLRNVAYRCDFQFVLHVQSPFDRGHIPERVRDLCGQWSRLYDYTLESGCLKVQPKVGDKLHLRLNIDANSIANKYCEGKLQRTLKREFKRT